MAPTWVPLAYPVGQDDALQVTEFAALSPATIAFGSRLGRLGAGAGAGAGLGKAGMAVIKTTAESDRF